MDIDKDVLVNGGTIVAIAGEDFAVIAADTQISRNNLNATSRMDKLFQVSPMAVMCSAGSWPDALSVIRLMRTAVSDYERTNLRPISIDVMSHMLSKTMYKRRSFPYHLSIILAGIDKKGKGAVFSFDSLGHCERVNYQATGRATAMVLPLLDNRLGFKNQSPATPSEMIEMTEAESLISNCMVIASELGNYSDGAGLMKIINKDGIKLRELPLRQE